MATSAPTDWTHVIPSSGNIPPFSVFIQEIQKSPQDDRDYRVIRLENGLTATLVHDAKADKAAASLDVAVGHLYDPIDMPGLAHFCEHLLFMGTEQFPKENEYSEFLSKNNGSSNAYTGTSNTNYFFSVGTPALAPALARFAAFFHSPLFSPSCTSRELNAVDSEHKKNHQSDMWRIFQLNKHLSKPGHPWSKFGSGHRESLSKAGKDLKVKGRLNGNDGDRSTLVPPSPIPSRISSPALSVSSVNSDSEADGGAVGRETRRRLVEWWSNEYCASRMRLCIIGKESLDEQAELVSSLFSPILNRGRDPLPLIPEHPFGPNEMGTLVSVQTIMSFHAVEISFPLEYQPPYWEHKPGNFISHFVGHEGPGSLHAYLKHKGWITSLSSGPQALARGFAMFKVTAHLTKEGFEHYRDVILATFKYFHLLRAARFDPFHQREISLISQTRFQFLEKRRAEDYAVWIAEHMSWPVPAESLLRAPQVTNNWEAGDGAPEKKVRQMLEGLRVEKGRAVLMAQPGELRRIAKGSETAWQKEPWYGTEFKVERFDEELVKEAQRPNDIKELFLPGPNEFIPTNLDVDKREVTEPLRRPHLIRETPLSTLWHKKDDQFWVPKAYVVIDIRSPLVNLSPLTSVLTRLFSDVVNDSLTEFSYDADLAGLSYNFAGHSMGLYVTLSGYNDKLLVLTRSVLERVKGIVVNPARLAVMKEQCKRDWENFFLGQSYQISDYYGKYLLTERQWKLEEKLAVLPSVTAEMLQQHVKELFSQVNMRISVNGNMYKDEAIKIAEEAEKGLGPSPIPPHELEDRALVLPEGSNFTWAAPLPNPQQANSCLTYYIHFGPTTDQHLRVTASLLVQILSEPAFNVLRTQEQLGYVVWSQLWVLPGHAQRGLRILVQSERGPAYLEGRVERFLEGMESVIRDMAEDVFLDQKAGLARKWTEKLKNLAEESGRFLNYIGSGQLDFLRNEKDAELLKSITKEDVLNLFMARVHPSSKTRSKLSVHMLSRKPRPPKVSSAAAQAFEALVRAAELDINETAWRDALGEDTPTAIAFGQYWKGILGEGETPRQLLENIPALVKKYPVEGEGEEEAKPGVVHIEDLQTFKSQLEVAEPTGPLVEWGDLPLSKF